MFLLPGKDLPQETWFEKVYLDKWVHSGFFFALVYLFYIPLRKKTLPVLAKLSVLALIYGIAIELIQKFWTMDRTFDLVDILFDGVGCMVAWFIGKRQAKK